MAHRHLPPPHVQSQEVSVTVMRTLLFTAPPFLSSLLSLPLHSLKSFKSPTRAAEGAEGKPGLSEGDFLSTSAPQPINSWSYKGDPSPPLLSPESCAHAPGHAITHRLSKPSSSQKRLCPLQGDTRMGPVANRSASGPGVSHMEMLTQRSPAHRPSGACLLPT